MGPLNPKPDLELQESEGSTRLGLGVYAEVSSYLAASRKAVEAPTNVHSSDTHVHVRLSSVTIGFKTYGLRTSELPAA